MSEKSAKPPLFSTRTVGFLLLGILFFGALWIAGWYPRRTRVAAITEQAREDALEIPAVTVAKALQAPAVRELGLPGTVQAIGDTPIYARAEGYIRTRRVDIGDSVKAGDVLVEIDSPELDQQLRQAKARLEQLRATLGQTRANEQQAIAQLELATITLGRWRQLVEQGVFSKQDGDDKKAQYDIRKADLEAARANIRAAEEAIRTQEAEIARLAELESFKRVTAPWDGIITVRNCAVGNLITPSAIQQGRDLFRLADIRTLRVFVNLPQGNIPDVVVGQPAEVTISDQARSFTGKVSRTATSVTTDTRTQLTEVLVTNQGRALLPGMYVQVKFHGARPRSLVVIPGDTLVTRSDGLYVAVVGDAATVRLQKVQMARDLGPQVEIVSGLSGNELLIVNPSDAVKHGVRVRPIPRK